MTQVIPLNSDGSRRVSVDLGDGIGVITFRSRYNSTVPGWYVDLYDADGNSIVFGLGLVAPHNIIRHLPRLVARIGDLRVIDIDGKGNINPDRLGVGVGLMHYAPGEFNSLYPAPSGEGRPLGYNLSDLFTPTEPTP